MVSVLDQVRLAIQADLPDALVYVLDPRKDGVHLQALVITDQFKGKTLLEQHRLVMKSLDPLFSQGLHAMGVKTFTQDKWEEKKGNYI